MTSTVSTLFRLPREDLAAPAAFSAEPDALQQWLERLPRTNLGQSTRALFQAVTELNRVRLPPAQRLRLLELLRPAIHFVCQGLSRHYLGQPLALPEQPLKIAELAHTLLEALTQGYARIAVQILQRPDRSGFKEPPLALARVLHRALNDTAHNLLRDLQLYRDPHPQTWARLHQLAVLARSEQLLAVTVADPQCGSSTLEASYLRALLLGSAHTYQLRQEEIARLYAQLPSWLSHSTLVPIAAADESPQELLINPASDQGPRRRELLDEPTGSGWLRLDTQALCAHLDHERQRATEPALDQLRSETIAQLQQAWQRHQQRQHERQPASGTVEVSIGLTAAHHFISGEIDFQLLLSLGGHQRLQPAKENPFLRRATAPAHRQRLQDVWESAYQAGHKPTAVEAIDYQVRNHHERQHEQQSRYQTAALTIVNVSAGGYCLQWRGDPAQVKAGEIIAIREEGHKTWRVGAIRWVRLAQTGPQLGIELLSPTATAYGARVINRSGPPGDYLRVLVLPAMPELGIPSSLIMPRLPFRTGQKVQLALRDDEARVLLTRNLQATGAFNRFEFNRLGGVARKPSGEPEQPIGSGFDGLWETL